jgi:hypothetical protein
MWRKTNFEVSCKTKHSFIRENIVEEMMREMKNELMILEEQSEREGVLNLK